MEVNNVDRLVKLLEYLGGPWEPILTPISVASSDENYQNLHERMQDIIVIAKENGIKEGFIRWYLNIILGYGIDYIVWRNVRKGKIVPTEELINDCDFLVATILDNAKKTSLEVTENKEYRKRHYEYRRNQVGISVEFIHKYLTLVCNYKLTLWQTYMIIYGLKNSDKTLDEVLNEFFDRTCLVDMAKLFPVKESGSYRQMNKNYHISSAMGAVFTLPGEGIWSRRPQIRRLKNYAKNNNITLIETKINSFHDTSWYDLKECMDFVQNGFYDAIIIPDSEKVCSKEIASIIKQYAYENGIPVIWLNEIAYR